MVAMTGDDVNCMDQLAGGAVKYVEQLTSRLFALQRKQVLCDVTIVVDDGQLQAHSAVLAASSEFICRQLQQVTASSRR